MCERLSTTKVFLRVAIALTCPLLLPISSTADAITNQAVNASTQTNFAEIQKLEGGDWGIVRTSQTGTVTFHHCIEPTSYIKDKVMLSNCTISEIRNLKSTYAMKGTCKNLTGSKEAQVEGSISLLYKIDSPTQFHLSLFVETENEKVNEEVVGSRIADCADARQPSICISSEHVECSDDKYGPHVPYFHDKFFPACERHDYCYSHGAISYGRTRYECDKSFESDMYRICDGVLLHKPCDGMARTFYDFVRNFGESHYKNSDNGSTCCAYDRNLEPMCSTHDCRQITCDYEEKCVERCPDNPYRCHKCSSITVACRSGYKCCQYSSSQSNCLKCCPNNSSTP